MSDIFAGIQRLAIASGRLVKNGAEILDYRLGKDGDPVIVVRDNPLKALSLVDHTGRLTNGQQGATVEGDYKRLRYFGVSIVWRFQHSQKEATQ